MPDKKISELVNLTSLATDDEFVVVDKGANATKRITATNLSKFPAGVTVPDAGTIGSASDPDAMSIASGGVVTFSQGIALAAGKGIDFSANANAGGMTSELLDDYEEGTWTPTITTDNNDAVVNFYGTRVGRYVKIGRQVIALCSLRMSITSAGTGDPFVTGLPFADGSGTWSPIYVGFWDLFATKAGYTAFSPFGTVEPVSSSVRFRGFAWTTGGNPYLIFTAIYETS